MTPATASREISNPLDRKLEAVLARLCKRLGPLFKTHAVKLPYLVDVVAHHELGRRITEGTHQAWEHGVVTREVFRFITHGALPGSPFRIESHPFSESGKRISLAESLREEVLDSKELAIVDFVAEEYGKLPAEQLGRVTKRLNSELAPEQWGSNAPAGVDEDAWLRLDPHWQDLCETLASVNLDDRSLWSGPVQDDPLGHLRRALNA
jgi:uncharacterized phage-associated protein